MRNLKLLAGAAIALALLVGQAAAVTKTASWTWPTLRTDGSAFPLTAIGNAVIYDLNGSSPQPNAPGTPVPCTTALTFPPTTANASCSVNVTTGHVFVLVVSDNETPPENSPNSNTVTVPLAVPAAVTNFAIQ